MLRSVFAFALLLAASAWGIDQQSTILSVPIKPTSWASGRQMYHEYCAVCHGVKGAGNGPAAAACEAKPANLTVMAKRNGGKFPYYYFYDVVKFGPHRTTAHRSSEMPIWYPLFLSLDDRGEGLAMQRMHNLASYVASLQVK